MGSSNETKAMQVGGEGGGDPPFSPSTFPPQYGRCFGGREEVEACLQSRAGFEARRNILLNCKSQPWPSAAPILCPGGGPEGVGNGQGCEVSFHFTYEDINAQRDRMIKNKPVYSTSIWGLHNLPGNVSSLTLSPVMLSVYLCG